MRVLFVDHQDSFSHNVVHLLGTLLGRCPHVVEARDLRPVAQGKAPDLVVLGPGPGRADRPEDRGRVIEWLEGLAPRTPLLGICFGMQVLAVAAGGGVRRARRIVHGSPVAVHHEGSGPFATLPDPVPMMRYHSWVVDDRVLPATWRVTARAPDGDPMAMQHADRPWWAVQFHPESVGSTDGERLLGQWLELVLPGREKDGGRTAPSSVQRSAGRPREESRASRRSPDGWFGVLVPEETRMRTGVGGKPRGES